MQAAGTISITDELKLTNPEMTIKVVSYDWTTNMVNVEIDFTEGAYKHSRTFVFNNLDGDILDDVDIYDYISAHETLNVFE